MFSKDGVQSFFVSYSVHPACPEYDSIIKQKIKYNNWLGQKGFMGWRQSTIQPLDYRFRITTEYKRNQKIVHIVKSDFSGSNSNVEPDH